ncbi:MAG: phosphoribosylamine--glycine ligase [Erysipelotrichaceae bacterium]|nr:phosphoribosylamine--glycine ligase [Erysipelotrichaceae bacterium]
MAKVLVIGSGGREHALAWKFSQSPLVEEVFVAPGNVGMTDVATCVKIGVNDFDALIQFVKAEEIDLTFVGPEVPLVNGIVDEFEKEGLTIFGPRKNAAIIEGSKRFSKDIMKKYGIPTANYESFEDYNSANAYLTKQSFPIVLKADGLAAGKGVVIAKTLEEAQHELYEMMCNQKFSTAGSQLVIEEYLEGEEFSLLAFVNGTNVYPMQIAQDHKRAFDRDEGLNTGGMGAYTPVTHLSNDLVDEAMDKIMQPMAKAMVQEDRSYCGILYGGFMATKDGVKTIEFNCRFGDPETEVILQALQGDLYQIVMDVLHQKKPVYSFSNKTYLGVVMAAKGYPEHSNKGARIDGIDQQAPSILHMGTAFDTDHYTINGGRVLFVSGEGDTIEEAYQKAYQLVESIHCDDLFYRHDIGHRALK